MSRLVIFAKPETQLRLYVVSDQDINNNLTIEGDPTTTCFLPQLKAAINNLVGQNAELTQCYIYGNPSYTQKIKEQIENIIETETKEL